MLHCLYYLLLNTAPNINYTTLYSKKIKVTLILDSSKTKSKKSLHINLKTGTKVKTIQLKSKTYLQAVNRVSIMESIIKKYNSYLHAVRNVYNMNLNKSYGTQQMLSTNSNSMTTTNKINSYCISSYYPALFPTQNILNKSICLKAKYNSQLYDFKLVTAYTVYKTSFTNHKDFVHISGRISELTMNRNLLYSILSPVYFKVLFTTLRRTELLLYRATQVVYSKSSFIRP